MQSKLKKRPQSQSVVSKSPRIDPKKAILKHEIERIKEERRKINRDREIRKLEYKKLQIMNKNNEIEKKLKVRKALLSQNQEMVRKIDVLKHDGSMKILKE